MSKNKKKINEIKNQTENLKENENTRKFHIFSLILVPVLSGFVSWVIVNYQISLEHETWKGQYQIIQFEKQLERKILRIETLSKQVNILQNIYAKTNRDTVLFLSNIYLLERDAMIDDIIKIQLQNIQINQEKFEMAKTELASTLQTLPFIFNDRSVSLLSHKLMTAAMDYSLGDSVKADELINTINTLKNEKKSILEIADTISEKFYIDGEIGAEFVEAGRQLLVEMYKEIGWRE